MATERFEVVVIGAGWYGLCAAKTYLQVNPNAHLTVLEQGPSIGGVWAKHLLYPGLKSNNQFGTYDPLLGTFEYPDFPMANFGVPPGTHIPGTVINDYLVRYAEKFGVAERTRCDCRLDTAEYKEESNQWYLSVESNGETKTIITDKLIMATGLSSEPFLPKIEGLDSYDGPFLHFKDLQKRATELLENTSRVTVFGGTKSSWDAVYLLASHGIKVDWVVRASGHGFCWMAPPKVTPAKKWLEKLVTMRFITWFSPCIWSAADGFSAIRKFLHGTSVGRFIVDKFFGILSDDLLTLNGYDKHPETKKMKPWVGAFWTASTLSVLNYPTDIFDYVRDGSVTIHIKDIDHLSPHTVHLIDPSNPNDRVSLESDAFISCTGWYYRPRVKFLPEGVDKQLGLPYNNVETPDIADEVATKKADDVIFSTYPKLKDQPIVNRNYKPMQGAITEQAPNTSFRMWRFIAPPTKLFRQSIAFCGMITTLNTSITSQVQALWAVAYLTGNLPGYGTTSEEEIQWEATLWSRFGRWRTSGGMGHKHPDFAFDAIAYYSNLLQDLGVEKYRKRGWLKQMFEPYGPEDYITVVDEWLETHD